jgi:hypothetical protein
LQSVAEFAKEKIDSNFIILFQIADNKNNNDNWMAQTTIVGERFIIQG